TLAFSSRDKRLHLTSLWRKPSFQSFVTVEVDGTVLGESEKKLRDASENSFHYDFSCSFQCSREPQAVAALARKLIIVTVSDFLPDERKADARTAVLGQAVLDLLPFLHGKVILKTDSPLTRFHCCLRPVQPTLDVTLDVSEALMSSVDLACSNLLRVTVETAFSVPEPWTQPAGSSPTSTSYTAALELPVSTQVHRTHTMLVFSDGALKAGGSREEEGRPKRGRSCLSCCPPTPPCPEPLWSRLTSLKTYSICMIPTKVY
uniref:Uncharacterized protein n=1 Tax=Neogobius melanostomus TaxID=47308 RepID=A0A8C6T3K9_9GOBI